MRQNKKILIDKETMDSIMAGPVIQPEPTEPPEPATSSFPLLRAWAILTKDLIKGHVARIDKK